MRSLWQVGQLFWLQRLFINFSIICNQLFWLQKLFIYLSFLNILESIHQKITGCFGRSGNFLAAKTVYITFLSSKINETKSIIIIWYKIPLTILKNEMLAWLRYLFALFTWWLDQFASCVWLWWHQGNILSILRAFLRFAEIDLEDVQIELAKVTWYKSD